MEQIDKLKCEIRELKRDSEYYNIALKVGDKVEEVFREFTTGYNSHVIFDCGFDRSGVRVVVGYKVYPRRKRKERRIRVAIGQGNYGHYYKDTDNLTFIDLQSSDFDLEKTLDEVRGKLKEFYGNK